MFNPDADASPVNPVPAVILILAGALAVIEIGLQLGARGIIGGPEAIGWRIELLRYFAFFDRYFDWMLTTGRLPLDGIYRFFTHPFIGGSFTTVLIGCVILLAIGNVVGRVFSSWAILLIFFVSAAVGALAYGLVMTTDQPLNGPFPPVYGLMGAFTWILWMKARHEGTNPLLAFRLPGFLLLFQVTFWVLFGAMDGLVADMAGLLCGFLMSFVFGPGGLSRVTRMRDRARRS